MNLANKISITRIILIPFLIGALIYSRMDIAFIIFLIAIISDGADGFIARTFNQKTQIGTVLDPVADKLLIVSVYICLAVLHSVPEYLKMPPYVPIVVISRDVIIIVGSVVIYFIKGGLNIKPSPLGKITTFFQMITVLCVLLKFRYSPIVWNVMVAFTVVSGLDYVVKGSRILNENHNTVK